MRLLPIPSERMILWSFKETPDARFKLQVGRNVFTCWRGQCNLSKVVLSCVGATPHLECADEPSTSVCFHLLCQTHVLC